MSIILGKGSPTALKSHILFPKYSEIKEWASVKFHFNIKQGSYSKQYLKLPSHEVAQVLSEASRDAHTTLQLLY